MDLFENAVFMLSCGRVKTELFENADDTASIYDVPEHAHGSLGITQGHFDCFLSKFEQRSLNVAASSCGRGYFRKRSSCGCGHLFIWIKKMHFQIYLDTCGRGLRFVINSNSSKFLNQVTSLR